MFTEEIKSVKASATRNAIWATAIMPAVLVFDTVSFIRVFLSCRVQSVSCIRSRSNGMQYSWTVRDQVCDQLHQYLKIFDQMAQLRIRGILDHRRSEGN